MTGTLFRNRTCRYCGVSPISGYVYCSSICRYLANGRALFRPRPTRVCGYCKRTFKPKAADRIKFCSQQCAGASKRKPRLTAVHECLACRCAIRRGKRCQNCASLHAMASKRAASRRIEGRSQVHSCRGCGVSFCPIGKRPLRGACQECAPRLAKAARHRYNATRKAVKRGATGRDRFSAEEIFVRHSWRCFYCDKPTPRELMGHSSHRDAPTQDHMVPVSRGGAHTRRNVVCACRECNTAKGAATALEFMALTNPPDLTTGVGIGRSFWLPDGAGLFDELSGAAEALTASARLLSAAARGGRS